MVYIVQEVPRRDLTAAEDYGGLITLLPHGDIALSAGPTVRRLRASLRNFNDEDYLLLMGDPVAIGIAVAVAADMNQGRVNLLKWDREKSRYFAIRVDVHARPVGVEGLAA